MSDKETRDRFAKEMMRRFDELTAWAVENWPVKSFPLMQSDFVESGKEISEILGSKLARDEDAGDDNASSVTKSELEPQYVSVTPMPWP